MLYICIMAYKVKYISTETFSTASTTSVERENDSSNTMTAPPPGYLIYQNIPRRCSRCRMYNVDNGSCKKKKKPETCRKSYSIKKQ